MKITRTGRGISGADLGTGQYLVGPDGTINMRQYGTIQVTGMTVAELKAALEKHLSKYMESPEVWVDVLGYNSKVFYIITDGAGSGDNVRRIPIMRQRDGSRRVGRDWRAVAIFEQENMAFTAIADELQERHDP